jgi:hypothetical protein
MLPRPYDPVVPRQATDGLHVLRTVPGATAGTATALQGLKACGYPSDTIELPTYLPGFRAGGCAGTDAEGRLYLILGADSQGAHLVVLRPDGTLHAESRLPVASTYRAKQAILRYHLSTAGVVSVLVNDFGPQPALRTESFRFEKAEQR